MIQVALVDDHQLFRKSLALLLSEFGDLDVAFESDDGAELLEYLNTSQIDVVLLDLEMPKINGYEVCKQLKGKYPQVKVLILSQLTTKESVHMVMEIGADGFCSKNVAPDQLEIAIRKLLNNGSYFDMHISAVLKEAILWEERNKTKRISLKDANLTNREIEIAKMIFYQMSSVEIGKELGISQRTVETHRNRLIDKTESKNSIGVALFLIKNKLVKI